jgi:xanthine dehydrogenase iron-sulfur cluster and FAD-binding subunit A
MIVVAGWKEGCMEGDCARASVSLDWSIFVFLVYRSRSEGERVEVSK